MKSARKKQQEPGDDKRRVLLVDDHPIVCEGLAQRINAEPDLMVCGQVRDAYSALDAIEKLRPDVAVVDIALGGSSGIELLKDIKVRRPELPALVLSMHDEALYAERSLHAGAKGYVMKQEQPEVLLRAIREILHGRVFLSDKVKDAIVSRLGGVATEGETTPLVQQLSDRELQIFEMIGEGYATHEIAERLHLSMKTVASHREHIKQKLNLKAGEELVRYAIHWQRHRGSGSGESTATAFQPHKQKTLRPAKSHAG
jgi:DNA-binding NarL/FixJ family response regulator